MNYTISRLIFDSTEDYLRQAAPALLSTIAPALFYLRPSMGSYLLHPCSRQSTVHTGTALSQKIFCKIKSLCDNLVNS